MSLFWEAVLKWVGGIASGLTILVFLYKLLKIRITYDLREEFDRILKKSKEDDKLLERSIEDLNASIEAKVDMIVDLQLEFRELKGATEASLKAQTEAQRQLNERICIRDNGRR